MNTSMCCICSGACFHNGPHYYCWMHERTNWTIPVPTPSITKCYSPCCHCYCQRIMVGDKEHQKCCNCGHQRRFKY